MNIRDTINERIVTPIIQENASTGDKSPTAQKLHRLAVAAITAGQGTPPDAITPAWRAYMTFLLTGLVDGAAADPTDLRRLLPEDGTTDEARQTERAYLVGNGMCGTGTGEHILDRGDGITTDALDEL
jgi:hypothetical protein